MSESEADKKRNKLGYQRISVACAHCRRRKIRCVMADGDPHNRCQNCIRLNKDCIFHPVDQPGGGETGPAHASTVTPSPRDLAAGQPFDTRPNNYTRLAPLPSNAPPELSTISYESPSVHGSLEFRPHHYPDTRWPASADLSTSSATQTHAGPNAGQGIMYGHSSDEYGGIHTSQRPIAPEARSYSYSSTVPSDPQWQMLQQQGRSMSYGNFEGHSPYVSHQLQPVHHATFPLDTQTATAMRGVGGPHSAPLSGGQHGFQQTSAQFPYTHPQMAGHQDVLGVWYGQQQQGYGNLGPGQSDDDDSHVQR